jgi:hypothetical protein
VIAFFRWSQAKDRVPLDVRAPHCYHAIENSTKGDGHDYAVTTAHELLRTWDQSVEGYLYLRWLIDPEVADCLGRISHPELEGGDVLREAVLNILEGPGLQQWSLNKAIDEFCTQLSAEDAALVREGAAGIGSWLVELQTYIRERAKPYHAMGLEEVAWMNRHNSSLPDGDFAADFPDVQEDLDRRNRILADEKLSVAIAALSRTTAGATPDTDDGERGVRSRNFLRQMLLDAQWRKEHSTTNSIRSTFEEWDAVEKRS